MWLMAVHLRGAGPTRVQLMARAEHRCWTFGQYLSVLLAPVCARPFWTGRELVAELQVALT